MNIIFVNNTSRNLFYAGVKLQFVVIPEIGLFERSIYPTGSKNDFIFQ